MAHITTAQRHTISCMLNQGQTKAEIAATIGKHRSVVCREIKRNKDQRNGAYNSDLADRKYAKRQKEKHKHKRFTTEVQAHVEGLLQEDYSPEQIVGFSKKNNMDCVSHERIYQHIWADKKKKGELHQHLRRKGRKYRKRGAGKDSRGIIKDRVSIEQRPLIVEKRSRFGDLEADLIIGKNYQQAIVTLNDRASGVLKMKKVPSKQADLVAKAINEMLEEWTPFIHTLTSDNGKEFAAHKSIAEHLNIDYFFAHPYHSWERGSNENLNGLVRQYFPKKSDFYNLSDIHIKTIEEKLNNRPRKRYNYENLNSSSKCNI
jgi:IS30 family transposase